MKVSSFGCGTAQHLMGRMNAQYNEHWSAWDMTLDEAIQTLERHGVAVSDYHVRQSSATSLPGWSAPDHNVYVYMQSTVQPKCRVRVRLSPETYVDFINDLEASGLWVYQGESS